MYNYIYICTYIFIYISADPVGVCGSKLDSVRFESRSEVKSEARRSESEVKRSESESEAKGEASYSEAIDEAREFHLGRPGILGVPGPPPPPSPGGWKGQPTTPGT